MRRVVLVALALVLVLGLSISVHADTAASSVSIFATVSNDASCQVSMNVKLLLDSAKDTLTFPVPAQATAVTLNGSRVRTQKSGDARLIDLSRTLGGMAGEFSFTVSYTLNQVAALNEAGVPQLQLPLLSGFEYPVEQLDFSVTLPAAVDTKPAFSSGYYQATIEQDLTYTVSGATVSGLSHKSLKDHETLFMTLIVPEDMFTALAVDLDGNLFQGIGMGVFGALALLYWLIFLRCIPARRQETTLPPEGCSAGEVRSVLTLQGADLNLMIFTWAQLGYLTVCLERNGRVTLHKRMQMGNERGSFEQRAFRNLFAAKDTVDTSTARYAQLCIKTEKMPPNIQSLLLPRSGNPKAFRFLAAGISLMGGAALGYALTYGSVLCGFWVLVMAAVGAWCGWKMQEFAPSLLLRDKTPLVISLALGALWIVLSLIAGYWWVGVIVTASQLVAGLMAFYSGRRTEQGRYDMSLILGLRKYLRTVSREELRRIRSQDPEYFFQQLPYALALGVDKAFARRMGKENIGECPYVTAPSTPHSPEQWSQLTRQILASMEYRKKQLPKENLLRLLGNLRKH